MGDFGKDNFRRKKLLISEIKSFLNSSFWLTPLNLADEKLEVLKDHDHNPVFVYPDAPLKRINNYIVQIGKSEMDLRKDNYEELILQRKLDELLLKLKLILARGSEDVTKYSGELYDCKFNKKSIAQAEVDSRVNARFKQHESLTARDLVLEINRYLNKYGLNDWSVELSRLKDFYVRIQPLQRLILISRDFNWDFADLDNTLAHEIDGHVLRAVNAAKQKKEIFHRPLPFYLKTEEGLASFLGDYCSTTSEVSRKHHALKYLAGNLAIGGSFSTVYQYLVSCGFTKELAFQRVFRLKRGFEDTSTLGCYMKEAVYYEGMLEVKEFIDDGGDVEKLYSGKFGLDDLGFTPNIENPIVPRRLKIYLDTH